MSERILIVDDDEKMRDGLGEVLEEEGYLTVTAGSGDEALKKLSEMNFDLVITDLIMPGIDGMEVLRRVKSQRPKTRVIMITAYATIDNAVEAMKQGASDYLVKPFDVGDVVVKVKKVLEEARLEEKLSRALLPLERGVVLKALANPTRLKVVDLLDVEDGLRFVQIKEKIRIGDPTKLSFHLRELKAAGLIEQDETKRYFLSEAGKKLADSLRILK